MNKKTAHIISSYFYYSSAVIFSLYVGIWIIFSLDLQTFPTKFLDLFSDTYGIIALFGSVCGFIAFKMWGGFKSVLGKSLFLFSLGLIFQFLGQMTYSFYRNFLGIESPYPSFAEIFYFGSIPIYIAAIVLLSTVSGLKFSLKKTHYKLLAIILPLVMVVVAYELFLREYDYSNSYLVIFLDFGYPILQAIQVSFAVVVYSLIKNLSGGKFIFPFMLIVIALIFQYLADTIYTYRVIQDTIRAADISDLLYLIAYFTMGLGLFQFVKVYNNLSVSLDRKNKD